MFKNRFKTGSLIKLSIFFHLIVCLSSGEQVCEFRLTSCPEDFNNKDIIVPENVTSFSSDFYVCTQSATIEKNFSIDRPPSIMFVIDHSGTMTGINTEYSPRDSGGARFKVTEALIDTVYKKYPTAEIGIVVFQEVLFFDTRDDVQFAALPSGYPSPSGYETQAYIPLLKLDSTLQNGKKGIDFLKGYLKTKSVTVTAPLRSTDVTVDLMYQPQFKTIGNTNINTAFDAVRAAIQKARNSKENQYVIFLSDGEPYPEKNSSNLHGGRNYNDFTNGIMMPTTFTVFLNPESPNPPRSISTMTLNIQKNSYSTNNVYSNVWTISTSYDVLFNLLLEKVINPIMLSVQKIPKTISINGKTYSNYNSSDSSFFVQGGFPLKEEQTQINMSIKYNVRNEYENFTYDSTVNIFFNVIRSNKRAVSSNIYITCRDTFPKEVRTDTLNIMELLNPVSLHDDIKTKLREKGFNINSSLYDKLLSLIKSNTGTIITLKSSTPLKPLNGSNSYGKGIIYDAVGNKVQKVEIKEIDKSMGYYGIYWDGANSSGRIVGAGTYLIIIEIELLNDKVPTRKVFRRKIGILNN
jgi:hypothetical protein